jgi:hypothetical protein
LNVCHGDFERRNIVCRGNDIHIIDFSHSSLEHRCPGQSCEELEEARGKLELDSGGDVMVHGLTSCIWKLVRKASTWAIARSVLGWV